MLISKHPTFQGRKLDLSPQAFGELRISDPNHSRDDELRQRFEEDGYLYLPGLLPRDSVMDARIQSLRKLDALGFLAPEHPLMEGVLHPGFNRSFMPELARDNPALNQILYDGPMMAFYERFLGGRSRHFDYTWYRAKPPGDSSATRPHYDIVYMGRGTKRLYTSWTPLGDIPIHMGGLMVLEGSHRLEALKATYGQMDVDVYCDNYEDAADIQSGAKLWQNPQGGAYSDDAIATQNELGGRWLTANYQMGDVLIFGMVTLHASMDNQTNQVRLSTDTRYQLASEPVDERWVGENPIAHGVEAKQGMIC